MKTHLYALFGCAMLVTGAANVVAAQTCEERATQLNDTFAAEYAALEATCYPSGFPPVAETENPVPLSPECQAQYDDVSARSAAAWQELYQLCPQLPQPVEMGEPRALTNQRLTAQNKKLLKKLRSLHAKYRRRGARCGV